MNEDATKKAVLKDKTKKELLVMRLNRSLTGVEVYLKSPILEPFMRAIAESIYKDEPEVTMKIDERNYQVYRVSGNMPTLLPTIWNKMAEMFSGLIYEGHCNVSCLRLVGLGEGVSFAVQGVHSREMIEEWASAMRQFVEAIWKDQIKPLSYRMTITVEQ